MDNNKRSTKKSNITIKIIKIIFSIILGVIAGPLELFWLKFIDVENRSFQIFWLIIGILSFSILYLVMLIILNKIINRNDHNSDKCWYIMRILAPISILITYFIIGKINNEGTISCVILSIIFMIPNLPLFIPFELANGSSTSTKNK